jgi:hypothetical protein
VALKTPRPVPPSIIFVTPVPPISGSLFVAVSANVKPLVVTPESPSAVTSPFPVAVVVAISVAVLVVTDGGATPPIKYLGIVKLFFSNHQHK